MDTTKFHTVRAFEREDAAQLLELMKALAEFEGYLEHFRVKEVDLIQYGLGKNPRFSAWVAHERGQQQLLGMAVAYVQPWTYSMQPTLVLKELYVTPAAQGRKIGQQLMSVVIQHAQDLGADRICWTVLADNTKAQSFYTAQGASHDDLWHNWCLAL